MGANTFEVSLKTQPFHNLCEALKVQFIRNLNKDSSHAKTKDTLSLHKKPHLHNCVEATQRLERRVFLLEDGLALANDAEAGAVAR